MSLPSPNDTDILQATSVSARNYPTHDLALCRFTPSFRDVEELLAERGIDVSNETVADFPVRKMIGGLQFIADLTLPYGQVVHDYLA